MSKHMGIVAALLLSVATPALAQDAAPPTADTVVATVNGTTITLGHMIAVRETLPEQYQALPDDVLFNGILDQLVQQTALQQSLGTPSRRDALIVENAGRQHLSGVALQAVVTAAVTDESLQAAYDARFKDATPQTEYNAAHILVDSEEKALALKAEIEGGADFAEVAKANSTDGAAANGGDLGWFGVGMMVKPFEDAVLAAEVGKVTGPVQTDFGWHLLIVKETRVAAQPTIDELRDELAAEVETNAVTAHVEGLTSAAEVTRTADGIDPAILRNGALLDQ
ncbi:MAG: peptidylprolyl isomerase [Rhodobacteraceae bacterium]|jgi:peptidyl-prolyl cis-trans isomerase C|nr:peptidylprolyl isomerase [Paracoccaceae bacterium]